MDLDSLYNRASFLYRQGDLVGSASACARIIEQSQNSAKAHYLLGIIHLQQNRAEEAVRSFDRAVQVRPDYAEAQTNRGNALRQLGRLPEALSSYENALSIRPNNPIALSNLGAVLSDMGRLPEAVEACQKAVTLNPGHVSALNNLGNALRRLKRLDAALVTFTKALALAPDSVEARFNRGLTFYDLRRFQQAIRDFDRVVAAGPSDATALFHRGAALYRTGRFADALASYESAYAVDPGFTEALNGRGTVQITLRRFEDALLSFDALLSTVPNHGVAHCNRGTALLEMGRPEDAMAAFDKACATEPQNPEILYNRAGALQRLGRHSEALRTYEAMLAINPACTGGWNNRAGLLRDVGRFDDAVASYDRAVTLNPDYAEAWYNRGSVLRQMKRHVEALRSYDMALAINPRLTAALSSRANLLWVTHRDYGRALRDLKRAFEIDPDFPYLRGDLLHLRMYGAEWKNFDEQVAALDAGVRKGQRVVSPFIYQSVSGTPQDLQRCAQVYTTDHYPAAKTSSPKLAPHEKIRVGYVSGEFRQQATSLLAAGLFEHHDRGYFEVVAFDTGKNDSGPMRKRLEAAFDRFIDISTLGDADAAARIDAEGIDILINLNGYFGEARMGVFARRPAPIQVNYLGFPGTLGADYMDYILADRIVIPEAERAHYSEQVAYLPDCYQVNDSRRVIGANIPSRLQCGLPETGFVFCNFNQSYKLTPAMFAAWMKIISQVEDSVLWLMDGNNEFARNLRCEADKYGIAGERLVFAPPLPLEQHLARHSNADLFLDSLPYNAHTTASDALWSGLPLVTCRGTAFASRVAASLLQAMGLPQLVAEDLAQYETLSVKLAREPDILQGFRRTLVKNRDIAPLFDTDRHCRNIEAAYRRMLELYQRGEAPRGFSV